MKLNIVLLLVIVTVHSQSGADDLVDITKISIMPQDYSHPFYTGYLVFPPLGNKGFHYFFYQSQSDPRNDPLILWLNGGPGCSSMLGMLYENGPLMFKKNSTQMFINPYSWNLNANVLYLESPAGVGFSYGKTADDLIANDTTTAKDNLVAMRMFFDKFPQFRRNDFYISGESYAGIYIPTLAKAILDFNEEADIQRINLKGFLIGNGCTHPSECTGMYWSIHQYQYLHERGFISDENYQRYRGECWTWNNEKCLAQQKRLREEFIATGANIYNLFDVCYHQTFPPKMYGYERNNQNKAGFKHTLRCSDAIGSLELFNYNQFREGLHIKEQNDTLQWTTCSDTLNYTINPEATYYLYPELIKAGLKILIYSGDADGMVPITGTKYWLQELKQQRKIPTKRPWRPWVSNSQNISGMIWQLDKLTFVSIRGSGHMVPTDNPVQSLTMLRNFIEQKEFAAPDGYYENTA